MSTENVLPYSTTLLVRDHCLCLHVQRAARALARRFDAAFRPLGLTHGQFSLLMSLNRPAPPPMAAVAGLLAMDRTTLTAALKPLVRRRLVRSSFVRVQPDKSHARSRVLILTAQGRALLARAVPIWKATHAAVEQPLSTATLAELRSGLSALT